MALVSHCDPMKGGSAFNTTYVSRPCSRYRHISVMMTMTLVMRHCEIGTRVSETRGAFSAGQGRRRTQCVTNWDNTYDKFKATETKLEGSQ